VGITAGTGQFAGNPPTLDEITAAMTRLCGLAVGMEQSPAETRSDLWEIQATVWFKCAPRERVDVYSFRAEATAKMRSGIVERALAEGADSATVERLFPNRPGDNRNAVHLRGYIGEEGTLFDVAALALESLGGTLTRPISDERRRRASVQLTPGELAARHRQHNREWLLALGSAPFQLARMLVSNAIDRLRRGH
jgi:hypothetical protein